MTTIHYRPCGGVLVPVFDGSGFNLMSFSGGLSVALNTTDHFVGKNYDLFVADDNGALRYGTGPAWASDVARSAALEELDGLPVNLAPISLRHSGGTLSVAARCATYVGSFRTTADGQASDTKLKRLVFSAFNQVKRPMRVSDPDVQWDYSAPIFRQINGKATNQVEFLLGLSGIAVEAFYVCFAKSMDATEWGVFTGIGLDSTTAFAADCVTGGSGVGSLFKSITSSYAGYPGIGYHRLVPLEYGAGNGTQRWFGEQSMCRTGLVGGFLG